ncbi:MAG: amino acid adenylation domain-containing protein, partial [Corynebacteriales bacterium]|nr:amino acid adenylation domain-containing protein [Mycobacteriales bacterium]
MPAGAFELSAAQRGIWFAQQALGSIPINIAEYVDLVGPVDAEALTAASNAAGREAGSGFLRLVDTGDVPMQVVEADHDDSISRLDFSDQPDAVERALEWMRAEYSRPIDVLTDRLTVSALIRVGPDRHFWYWRAHHIATDGFGATAMLARVAAIYTARLGGDEPPTWRGASLTDLVEGERTYRDSTRFENDRAYWAERNAGLPGAVSLAARREPPGAFSRLASVELRGRVGELVDDAAAESSGSAAPAVIAAFATYLSRMTDIDDVVLSLPVSARNTAKLRSAAGMVSNVVPLRVGVSDDMAIGRLITDAQTALTGALRRQLYRHEDMRRDIGQGTGERGLFGPSVNLMMFQSEVNLGETVGQMHVLTTGPVEDLAVNIYPGADGNALRLDLEANPRLYSDDDLRGHLDRFVDLVERMLGSDRTTPLGEITVGSADEIAMITDEWNATDHPVESEVLGDIWRRQARATPDAPALHFGAQTRSYGEFGADVARLARHLIALGIGPDRHVAIAMRRSFDLFVAVHAVLEAGGAYVPIDLDSPGGRQAAVLRGSAAPVVLTTRAEGFVVPEGLPETPTVVEVDAVDLDDHADTPVSPDERHGTLHPDNTAYVIYTSGSTGAPKGVAVSHRAIVNRLRWMQAEYPLGGDDVVLHKTPVTFDVSVWELLWALQVGASVAIAVPDGHRDPEYLAGLIADRGVTAVHFVPSMLALFVESAPAQSLTSLRAVFASGEALTPSVAGRLGAITDAALHNLYGPTEAAVDVTYHRHTADDVDSVPIGQPVWNTRVWVLDRALRPVPVGAVGELYLGGVQLARGYVGDPVQTSGRFVACPFEPGPARMYRTGDLVRWTPDGSLDYVGRSDFQVKVRGLRIELGEIEAAVLGAPGVRETVVTVHQSAQGQRLVAYVVPAVGQAVDTAAVVGAVRGRVPAYMVPDAVVTLEEMPLGTSGKVDRKALPEPDFSAHAAPFRAPTTDVERAVVGLVEDLLGRDDVGLDDSFFGLGGDSIMSIQLVSRARAAGLHFTSRQVFEHKTIGDLAAVVRTDDDAVAAVELPGGAVGEVDLTPIVRSMTEIPESVGPFAQSVEVPLPEPYDPDTLRVAVRAVVDRHDILRSRLSVDDDGRWHHVVDEATAQTDMPEITTVDVMAEPGTVAFAAGVDAAVRAATDSLDPEAGRVAQFVLMQSHTAQSLAAGSDTGARRLVIVLHHLVVDGVSWRILLPDLATAWAQHSAGVTVDLAPVGTSMRRWARGMIELAATPAIRSELAHWRAVTEGPNSVALPLDPRRHVVATLQRRELHLTPELTETLLTRVPQAFHAGVNDGLLAALALAVSAWRSPDAAAGRRFLVSMEAHGREEELLAGSDLSRTVGWFTTVYPVALDLTGIDVAAALSGGEAAGVAVKTVKEQLASVPRRGVGYGLLRHLDVEGAQVLAEAPEPSISVNYLGRLAGTDASGPWVPEGDQALRGCRGANVPVRHALDINASVVETAAGPQLHATLDHPDGVLTDEEADELADLWHRALEAVARHAASADAGGLTPSDLDLVSLTQADVDSVEARYDVVDVWPLAPLQTGLLFHSEMSVGSVDLYTAQMVLELSGVDVDRMRRSAQALVDRHPTLRTGFVTAADGTPVSVVSASAPVAFVVHDLSRAGDDAPARAAEIAHTERVTAFDMAAPPLLRFAMIAFGDNRFRMIATNHHILLDGWSMPVFMGDLFTLYAAGGEARALPAPPAYRTYLSWLAAQDTAASIAAWSTALGGFDEPTLLVGDGDRGTHSTGVSEVPGQIEVPGQVEITIAAEVTERLTEHARETGITFNTMLQVSWAIVLARLVGRDDIVFGTTVSGRPPEVPGVETMLGLFINTVPVRVMMHDSDDVAALCKRVAHEQADLLDHHTAGLADITAAVDLDVLFDTMMVYESYPLDREALAAAASVDGMTVTDADVVDATHYPLTVIAITDPDLRLSVKYLPSMVDADRAADILGMLISVLEQIAHDREMRVLDVDVLDADTRTRLLQQAGSVDRLPAPAPLPDLLAAAASAGGARDAVVSPAGSITYAELDRRSDALARRLIAQGVGTEQIVALGMNRSVEFVLGLWAVAKTGAAYLPVDMRYPTARIEHMLTDSGAVYGLSTSSWRDVRPTTVEWLDIDVPGVTDASASAPVRDADRLRPVTVANLAYMIYTSGTTGLPKGVAVTHGGLAALMAEQSERFVLTPSSRTLHFASPSFDASVLEMLLALAHGSTMVIAPSEIYGGEELHDLLADHGVTHGFVTPAALASVDPDGLDEFETVVVGGEACPPELVARWAPGRRMFNGYGPTEATCFADIAGPMEPGRDITIGRPVRGLTSLVLDRRLQPVAEGVDGELYLSGAAVARGYHRRPGLTADRFVANPHGVPGDRMYRTGDVVRWVRTDSGLEVFYVGRRDFQVKIRGFRIELGEIDAALAAHPDITFATTVGTSLPSGATALVAYVVPAADAEGVTAASLKDFVAGRLAPHMVPSIIVTLDTIPLTRTGKLDRAALPAPDLTELAAESVEPRTDLERTLAEIVADVVGLPAVGVTDSFFDVGGNSLLATKAAARIGSAVGRRVAVRELFDHPTVASLAAHLGDDGSAAESAAPTPSGHGDLPALRPGLAASRPVLSPTQQQMWLLNRIDPQSAAYNIAMVVHLRGPLDRPALAAAARDVVGRHGTLRTIFPETATGPYQDVRDADEVEIDLTPQPVTADSVDAAVTGAATTGFDLTHEFPVRFAMFEIAPDDVHVVVVVHHISADGSSMAPLARDVMTAYAARTTGDEPAWAHLPVQYVDYAAWFRATLGDAGDPGSTAARSIEFWRGTLAGSPEIIDLPLDRPRPPTRSLRGDIVHFAIDEATYAAVAAVARDTGTSVFMVVHAALTAMLARTTGSDDVVIGTPVAGRGVPEIADVVGVFVNSVPLRVTVDEAATVGDFLTRVRTVDLDALDHADLPFEAVVDALGRPRTAAYSPVFQVLLSFQNTEPVRFSLAGLDAEINADSLTGTAQFDIAVNLSEVTAADGSGVVALAGSLTFATDLFDPATARTLADRFTSTLRSMIADTGAAVADIDIWGATAPAVEASTPEIATPAARPVAVAPDRDDLLDLIAAAAAAHPDTVAIDVGSGQDQGRFTFADIAERLVPLAPMAAGGLSPDAVLSVALSTMIPAAAAAAPGSGGSLVELIDEVHTAARRAAGDVAPVTPESTWSPDSSDTLAEIFADRVWETPDAIALTVGVQSLTYAEFSARSNRLARHLISIGVGPDVTVGLAIGRSVDLLVGMYAVVAAGGAYVPIDLEHPPTRIAHILRTSRPACVLTVTGAPLPAAALASDADAPGPDIPQIAIDTLDLEPLSATPVTDTERTSPLRADNIAYVIFTSGSTGMPKGVAVSHRAIVNRLRWMQDRYRLTPDDVVVQKTPATFDVSVWEFFWPLQIGARLVVAEPGGHRDVAYLTGLIAAESITTIHFVPSMLGVFVTGTDPTALGSLRLVFTSGEALGADVARAMSEASSAEIHNLYGPTEAAVDVTHHQWIPADEVTVPIGVPVANTRVAVLDRRLRQVPAGVAGELYLLGVQLARGYLGRADLSADRFLAAPATIAVAPGERMYRTGDLVRMRSDGELDYLGRTYFQVKLHGLRIELGEIETALTALDTVASAAVLVAEHRVGARLVGYVVPAPGAVVDVEATRVALTAVLPEYMVPAVLVSVPEMPVNANGKLDRTALAQIEVPDTDDAEYVAPTDPVEEIVAGLFGDMLGVDRVSTVRSFFELGGNSLMAAQLSVRVHDTLGVAIGIRDLFEAQTVAQLARLITQRRDSGESGSAMVARFRPIAHDESLPVPLSLAQQRLWFINTYDPTSGAYNIPLTFVFTGDLDIDALSATLVDLVDRQRVLRTIYPSTADGPHQVVVPTIDALPPVRLDSIRRDELWGRLREFAGPGFDVTTTVPVRTALWRLNEDRPDEAPEHILVFVIHHIAADGLSMQPLAADLLGAYEARLRGDRPALAPLAAHYTDFAIWQSATFGDETDPDSIAARQLEHWRTVLAGAPEITGIPTDRPRGQSRTGIGATEVFELSPELHRAIVATANSHGVSRFMVFHAALAALLARHSGDTDIVVGAPIGGRGSPELDALVGMFVNTLALRLEVDPAMTVADLLIAARDTDLDAFGHSDVPFERVVDALAPTRTASHTPIFQVVIGVNGAAATTLDIDGLGVALGSIDTEYSKFDLTIDLGEQFTDDGAPAGVTGFVGYATDIFDAGTAATMGARLTAILTGFVDADAAGRPVGEIPIMTAAERSEVTPVRGRPAPPLRLLSEILDDAARVDPDATALVCGEESMSYRELDARSNRIARELIDRGLGTEDVVALAIGRSISSVLGVWGVVRSGAAFVPVDPNYPADRVAHMLTDSGARLVITRAADGDLVLPDGASSIDIDDPAFDRHDDAPIRPGELLRAPRPENCAYIIYTSGTTGKPKGAELTHRGMAPYAAEIADRYRITPASRTLHVASPSFDASVLELLLATCVGATMVIVPTTIYGGEELHDLLARERVTHAFITPAALASVNPEGLPDFTEIAVGGEAVPAELFARWAPGRNVYNGYGPTEATIMTNISAPVVPGEQITIGGPITGVSALVLDARLQPVPVGVPGELYVSGPGVARAYHDRPGLTAERFVANPAEPGERMYRTGDVVRWVRTADRGLEIVYLSRSDHQVKVRGFRIELGEIDSVLAAHPAVEFAATLGVDGPGGGTALASYVTLVEGSTVGPSDLTSYAARFLPQYMVPSAVTVLDEVPLTPTGKLDRRVLPTPEFVAAATSARDPETPLERAIAHAFAEVLDLDRVGADDSFFDLGGNSLAATRVIARINENLNVRLGVRVLFESSTVADLAAAVAALDSADGITALPLTAGPRPDRVPLSLAQQRMWFLNRLNPDVADYNIPLGLRLRGTLDLDALHAALADLLARQEILRTVYPDSDDEPFQRVLGVDEYTPELEIVEVAGEDDLLAAALATASAGFDVTAAPPLRAGLFRLSDDDHVLLLVIHHIAADGSSLVPLATDLMSAYTARAAGDRPHLRPLSVQYADYAIWQRAMMGDENDPESPASRQIAFWREHLAGLPELLAIPTDRPRTDRRSIEGGEVTFTVDAELQQRLAQLAREHDATMFMVLHAAYAALLSRMSGTGDVAVGTPIAGRTASATEGLVGMFVNTLVLRTTVPSSATFVESLAATRQSDLAAFGNADLPFEQVVEVLAPARSRKYAPLVQATLTMQNIEVPTVTLPGLEVSALDLPIRVAKSDLGLTISESFGADGRGRGIEAVLDFTVDIFDHTTVEAMAERFLTILTAVADDENVVIGDIDILTAAERDELADSSTGDPVAADARPVDTDARSLDQLLATAARINPDGIALSHNGVDVTYGALQAKSAEMAATLGSVGIGPEAAVTVALSTLLPGLLDDGSGGAFAQRFSGMLAAVIA